MDIPDWVREVLSSFENRTTPFHEAEIADALHAARKGQGDQTDSDWKGFIAEWSAFLFVQRRDQSTVWNTYFAPMMSGKNVDGSDFFSPDIRALEADVFAYWEERVNDCRNPIMRARYSDLIWDLKRVAIAHKPSYHYAQIAIDSYLDAVDRKLYPMEIVGIQWLQRALDLSCSIRDSDRTGRIVAFMFEFYDGIAKPQFMGTWIFLFDDLYGKKFVSSEQESRIIANLEGMLAMVSDTTATDDGVYPTLDPWGAQAAGERLAEHYRRMKDSQGVNRVIMSYGKAFEHLAGRANPMMAMAWLQPVIERYEQEGLKAEAERLQVMSAEKGKDIDSDLKRISVNIEATKEDVDEMVETLIGSGDLATSLSRVASYFIPRTSDARALLAKLKTDTPFLNMIPITIIEKDGHSSATIGSLEDDPDGRLHHQLAQLIHFYQPFLAHTWRR